MTCKRYRKLFSAYLDGDLDAEKRRQFEEHLAKCGQCASEFADFEKLVSLTASLPKIQPSSSFDRTLKSRLEAVEQFRGFRALFGRRTAAVFGAACLVLLLALSVFAIYSYRANHRDMPTERSYAGEEIFTNFVMPSISTTQTNRQELGDMVTSTRENSQENRAFILPFITGKNTMQDKPKSDYVIRRISLTSTSEEAGL